MVEQAGKVNCKLEATVIGVEGGTGCPSNQQKVKTEPESAMHVQKEDQKIKLEKGEPTFPMYLPVYTANQR